MDTIVRSVHDIDSNERDVLERLLGRRLEENQQILIRVVTPDAGPTSGKEGDAAPLAGRLPEWCRVYEGLSEEQIAEVEKVVLQRSDFTRASE